jgi:hypothetical protein
MPVSPSELKKKSRHLFTGPSGAEYIIRALRPSELIEALDSFPDLSAFEEARESKAKQGALLDVIRANLSTIEQRMEDVISKGLIEPAIGKDDLTIDDIPTRDQAAMFAEILTLSGYNKTEAAQMRPTGATDQS